MQKQGESLICCTLGFGLISAECDHLKVIWFSRASLVNKKRQASSEGISYHLLWTCMLGQVCLEMSLSLLTVDAACVTNFD